jgi:hypothetical protein
MAGREALAQRAVSVPQEIRQSGTDPVIYLFYHLERIGRWTCVVVKRLNGEGFVVTTYPADAIKEGSRIWAR